MEENKLCHCCGDCTRCPHCENKKSVQKEQSGKKDINLFDLEKK